MAPGNVSELVTRLTSYSEALDRHLGAMQKAFERMQESFDHLRRVWGGDGAEAFYADWARTAERLEETFAKGRAMKALLDERVASLRMADRTLDGSGLTRQVSAGGDQTERNPHLNDVERAAMEDLAARRRRDGLPVAGTDDDESTLARLDVPGSEPLYGANAPDRQITITPLNAQTRRHAEAEVFQQVLDRHVQAEAAVMYVDRPLCKSCGIKGGVGSMLRATGMKVVEVIAPDGRFRISAERPSIPVRIEDPA